MARKPCCAKEGLKRGAWTSQEDKLLSDYMGAHGVGRWRTLPANAGLSRCGKSCRLRWLNYLRPDIKRGNITEEEEELILRLHKLLGNRWSLIAGRLPGRTDNEIKNYWNTHLRRRVDSGRTVSKQVRWSPANKAPAPAGKPSTVSVAIRTKPTRSRLLAAGDDPLASSTSSPDTNIDHEQQYWMGSSAGGGAGSKGVSYATTSDVGATMGEEEDLDLQYVVEGEYWHNFNCGMKELLGDQGMYYSFLDPWDSPLTLGHLVTE